MQPMSTWKVPIPSCLSPFFLLAGDIKKAMDVRKYARANINIPASSLSSCFSCSPTSKHGKARLEGNYTAGMFIVVFIPMIQHRTVQGCCHDA